MYWFIELLKLNLFYMSTNTAALPPSIHRVLGKWRRNLREWIPYIKIKEKGFYEGTACNPFFPLFVDSIVWLALF